MQVTYSNYKMLLPERKYQTFRAMADRSNSRKIVLSQGSLRFANIDE